MKEKLNGIKPKQNRSFGKSGRISANMLKWL